MLGVGFKGLRICFSDVAFGVLTFGLWFTIMSSGFCRDVALLQCQSSTKQTEGEAPCFEFNRLHGVAIQLESFQSPTEFFKWP